MDAVSLLRDQIGDARGLFEATLADVTAEQAGWLPAGRALPIAAHLAHVLASQDMALHGLLERTAPLVASTWAGRAGFAEPPPFGPGQSWDGWARGTRFDLAALRGYGAAVYAATDDLLERLDEAALARSLDLSALGLGERSVAWLLTTGWVTNVDLHCGEISCIKGLLGARGYPA
jgi:hypothetical protein